MQSLLLDPSYQARRLSAVFLKDALSLLRREKGAGKVVGACWAENEKLRACYGGLGFILCGEFPQENYRIAAFVYELNNEQEGG